MASVLATPLGRTTAIAQLTWRCSVQGPHWARFEMCCWVLRGVSPHTPGYSTLILHSGEDVQRGRLGQTFGDVPHRSEDAYDRFSAAVGLPLTVLALLWAPVLVIPFVVSLRPAVTAAFEAIDFFVWAAFAVEYLIRLWLAPARRTFGTHHLVDLAVITLPLLRPLRAARLLRVLALARVGTVLANALTRAKDLLPHRGLHYVLLTVGQCSVPQIARGCDRLEE